MNKMSTQTSKFCNELEFSLEAYLHNNDEKANKLKEKRDKANSKLKNTLNL